MPKQETFLKESAGPVTVEVIKTYDSSYAREVFDEMELEAKEMLAQALEITRKYAPEDIPEPDVPGYDDLLWDELDEESLEDVREYPRKYSFFVVNISRDGKSKDCYVSADWPSAESFAKNLIQGIQA
jgi:hypothetical protein